LKDTLRQSDPKAELRSVAIAKRDAIPLPVRKIKDAAIAERVFGLDIFSNASVVLLYASFRSEVSTGGIIEKALESGKKVLLPKVDTEETKLRLYEIKSVDDLEPGYMGIPEPQASEENSADIDDIDMVIVPGAAFDENGNRLGYGKGYYDRLLSGEGARPAIAALAYEEQIVKDIPAEPHDVKMELIITDRRVLVKSPGGSGNGQKED
jgi:5-formyltetrahydrofolate cyclo-ligase